MKEIMRVCLSDNGKEFLMYDGDELERVIAVSDLSAVAETAREAARDAFLDDFSVRNGRHYNACMGYEDCTPGMCDEHHAESGAY